MTVCIILCISSYYIKHKGPLFIFIFSLSLSYLRIMKLVVDLLQLCLISHVFVLSVSHNVLSLFETVSSK